MKRPSKWLILVLLGIFVLAGCQKKEPTEKSTKISSQESSTTEKASDIIKSKVPTLLLHGSGGNASSLNGLIQRFDQAAIAKRSILLTVSSEGVVTESGTWEDTDNPLIQVIFEDSQNNEWNQAEWLKNCLQYLQKTYQINEVNLLGHSMGGVSILRYLTAFGEDHTLPKVDKVVAIGAPFNEFNQDSKTPIEIDRQGPEIVSPRLNEYQENAQNYPIQTKFLNIAGESDDTAQNDGIVPVASVLSVGYFLRNLGVDYQYQLFSGDQAEHSQLHENPAVDVTIVDFLWKK